METTDHRFVLQPYKGQSTRHTCPACNKTKEFARYIDTETTELLPEHVGKCNRIDKCGYHFTPKQFFDQNGIKPGKAEVYVPKPQSPPRLASYIDFDTFNKSLGAYENNNFINYLDSLFNPDLVDHLINIYKIGTSARYNGGATVFWQIDASDNIRTGKIIKYDSTGHRIKGCNNWVHSVLGLQNFNLKQCFFGEHILKYAPDYTVGIVESEKTAIILQAQIPDLIWLAAGGAEGINKQK